MGIQWLLLVCLTLVYVEQPHAEFTLQTNVMSEVVERGATQSDDEPAVGGTLEWNSSTGWFAGADGYYSDKQPSGLSRSRKRAAYIGWFNEISLGRAVEFSVSRNEYIGASSWNYTEYRADYHFSNQMTLTAGYSPDYYGRGSKSVLAGATWRPHLGASTYLLINGGAIALSGEEDELLRYAELGIGVTVGRFDLLIVHHRIDADTARIFLSDKETTTLQASWLIW